jgi:SPP1 gp7 family putative phage head morphogenesis protein
MAGNPAKPKHPSNPVGQTARIRKARRDWAAHTKPIQAWLLQQFDQIPRQEIAANVGRLHVNRYVYQISIERLNAIVAELVQRLGSGPTKRRWLGYVREAYTQGTGQQVINLQNIAGEQYNRTLAEVLRSDSWLTRIAMIESRVFEQMEAFEGDTANDLARVLRVGVENGLNPREVAEDVRQRFGVSQSRANRISRTEITGAYRRARMDEDADANRRLGIRTKLLWYSARSETTRPWHASRHGLLYSQEEVREFYSQGGEQINCKCSQASVAVNENGEPLNPKFVKEIREQYTG